MYMGNNEEEVNMLTKFDIPKIYVELFESLYFRPKVVGWLQSWSLYQMLTQNMLRTNEADDTFHLAKPTPC